MTVRRAPKPKKTLARLSAWEKNLAPKYAGLVRGAIAAGIAAVVDAITTSISSGAWHFDWKVITGVGIMAALRFGEGGIDQKATRP